MTTDPRRGQGATFFCAAFLVSLMLVSLLLLTSSVASAQAPTKANRAAAEQLTNSLMALNAQHQQAPPAGKAALLLQLHSVAAKRQQVLSTLIQTSPGEALRVAIPGSIAATLPASIQSFVEQETDAQGELEVMYEDAQNSATLHHYLKTGNQRLELKFAANAPTNLLTGSIVHVHGTRMNNVLALGSGKNKGNINPVQPPPPVNALGAQNTLVILANFKDLNTQPFSVADAQNRMFGGAGSVTSWELENSLQQTWLTGDVAGW